MIAGTDELTAGLAAAKVRDVYVDARYWTVFDDGILGHDESGPPRVP